MTDVIDVAQRRQQEEIDQALAQRCRPVMAGRDACANLDCGEPITAVRRGMGAQLCLDCQHRAEREAQQCARTAV